jgi:hypothetical protein
MTKKNKTIQLLSGDQEGLFKLAVQLRKCFNSVIYNTATGYVLLVYLTNICRYSINNDKPSTTQQPKVTPVIRFKIQFSVTNLNSPS